MRIYQEKESACVDSVRKIEMMSMWAQCVYVRQKRDRVGDRFGDDNDDDRL